MYPALAPGYVDTLNHKDPNPGGPNVAARTRLAAAWRRPLETQALDQLRWLRPDALARRRSVEPAARGIQRR